MKRILTAAFAALLFIHQINAQVVVTDPPFPVADKAVTIIFNATGTGLEGYTGDVYAHTGVTVNGNQWQYVIGNWGDNNSQPKLTNIGTDLYKMEVEPSIRSFYGVSASAEITELCLVFRSADGNQQTSPDIFYPVYEDGLAIQIILPEERPLIVALNDTVHVEGNTNNADSTFLYVADQLVYADTGSTFAYDIIAETSGKTWIRAVAKDSAATVADSLYYFVRPLTETADPPEGTIDGINYIDGQTVILSLYAPGKEYVFAIGDFSNWELENEYFMKQSFDGKRFWVQLDGLETGREYIYQYLIDGTIRVGDIYADKVSDPWNDKWINDATYPGLIDYPEGKTKGIATVFQTGQTNYSWEIEDFNPPAVTDLVVYELHVRDFIGAHTFAVLTDTLDYLERLGINVIELMPFNEFEGNSSWGYNPNYYFAPDKYYGPKDKLKAFIDECHKRGMAVVMDIVLNHAYNTCPLVMMYWDNENNRPAEDNPWFNTVSPNPVFSWGNDFNHESPDTKNFVDRVTRYWIEEYKIDGYRFDFSKGFTNKPGDGGAFDQSRIDILTRMANEIWSYRPEAYVILEHFAANSEEIILSSEGMLLWGNSNYNYNEASMGYNDGGNSDFSWISYQKRGWSAPRLVGYMESHDEERMMYKNVTWGNSSGSYDITDTATALQRQELAANFLFTIPGPKMIWQFGERGYDISIDYNGRVGEKPPRWNYMDNWRRRKLFYTWSSLIKLKKELAVFETSDYDLDLNGAMKKIRLTSAEMSVVVLGNFDVVEGDIVPAFYSSGTWYDYWTGDSIEVSDVNAPITLAAGEYRLYTDQKLQTPELVGTDETPAGEEMKISLYPNPAGRKLTVASGEPWTKIEIFNLTGQHVLTLEGSSERVREVNVSGLGTGIYFLRAQTAGGKVTTRKFIKR